MIKKYENKVEDSILQSICPAVLEKSFFHTIPGYHIPQLEYGKTYYGQVSEDINVFRFAGYLVTQLLSSGSTYGEIFIGVYGTDKKVFFIQYDRFPHFFGNKNEYLDYIATGNKNRSLNVEGYGCPFTTIEDSMPVLTKKYTFIEDKGIVGWKWYRGTAETEKLYMKYILIDKNGEHICFSKDENNLYITREECVKDNFKLSDENFDEEDEEPTEKEFNVNITISVRAKSQGDAENIAKRLVSAR